MGEKLSQLKDKLSRVYNEYKWRKSVQSWEKILKEPAEEDYYGTNVMVIDFLTTHKFLPLRVWRHLGQFFNWETSRSLIAELFSEKTADMLCDNINQGPPIRLELVPDNLGGKEDRYISLLILAGEYLAKDQLTSAFYALKAAGEIYSKHPDYVRMQAELALKKCDLARAENLLDRLLAADSKNGDALLLLAILYRDQGFTTKSARFFRSAYIYNCEERRLAIESGELFRRTGNDMAALCGYIQFLRREPYDEEMQKVLKNHCMDIIEELEPLAERTVEQNRTLAAAYLCSGRREDALDTGLPIDKGYYKTVEGCLLAGHLLWLSGETEAAEKAYHRSVSLGSHESKGYYYLGELKRSKGATDEAVVCFEKALTVSLRSYPSYMALARYYIKKGDYANADMMASVLLRAGADRANACLLKGAVLEAKEKPEDALVYYEKALEIDKKLMQAHTKRIDLLKKMGLNREAEIAEAYMEECSPVDSSNLFEPRLPEDFMRIRQYKIKDPEVKALVDEAESFLVKGKITEAYYSISKADEIQPDTPYIRYGLGMVLYYLGRYQESIEILKPLTSDPAYSERAKMAIDDMTVALGNMTEKEVADRKLLAKCYYEAGKRKSALAILEKISDEEGLDAELNGLAGKCALSLGKIDLADKYFEASLAQDPVGAEVTFFRAMTLQALGRNEEALKCYDDAIAELGAYPDPFLFTGKISLLNGTGKFKEAIEVWDIAKHQPVVTADMKGYAGLSYFGLGDRENASMLLSSSIDGGSDYIEIFLALAEIGMDAGKQRLVIKCCNRGLDFHPDNSELLTLKARALLDMGKMRSSEYLDEKAMESNKESDEAFELMGRINSERSMYREAVECYSKALDLSGNKAKYCGLIADCLAEIGKYGDAIEYYTIAIENSIDAKEESLKRAVLLNKANRDEEALETLKQVLDINPDDPDGLLALADILSEYVFEDDADASDQTPPEENQAAAEEPTGKRKAAPYNLSTASTFTIQTSNESESAPDVFDLFPEDAAYYYTKAIENRPGFVKAYMNRGKYYVQNGDYDKAVADFEKVVELESDSTEGLMNKAVSEMHMQRYKEAIDDLDRVLTINDTYMSAYNYMVKCYNLLGMYTTSIKVAEAGLCVDSSYVYLNANRGVAYYYLKKYNNALKDLDIAIGQHNRVHTATLENSYYHRGLCREALGNSQAAMEDFVIAWKFDPDDPRVLAKIQQDSKTNKKLFNLKKKEKKAKEKKAREKKSKAKKTEEDK